MTLNKHFFLSAVLVTMPVFTFFSLGIAGTALVCIFEGDALYGELILTLACTFGLIQLFRYALSQRVLRSDGSLESQSDRFVRLLPNYLYAYAGLTSVAGLLLVQSHLDFSVGLIANGALFLVFARLATPKDDSAKPSEPLKSEPVVEPKGTAYTQLHAKLAEEVGKWQQTEGLSRLPFIDDIPNLSNLIANEEADELVNHEEVGMQYTSIATVLMESLPRLRKLSVGADYLTEAHRTEMIELKALVAEHKNKLQQLYQKIIG